jgi:hypothetical protein
MESYVVHFDRHPGAKATSEPSGIVEDMKNRIKNPFKNTQELLLLLGQFDRRSYPWQAGPGKNNNKPAGRLINKQTSN